MDLKIRNGPRIKQCHLLGSMPSLRFVAPLEADVVPDSVAAIHLLKCNMSHEYFYPGASFPLVARPDGSATKRGVGGAGGGRRG